MEMTAEGFVGVSGDQAAEGASNAPLLEGDLDALASIQIQEELERLSGPDGNLATHAMITADGQTVAVTFDPETGQYVTPDGQTFMVQEDQAAAPEKADLSSLAEAAAHHVMVDMQQPVAESVLSTSEPAYSQEPLSEGDVSYQTTSGQTIRIVKKEAPATQPALKIVNADGSLSELNQPQQQLRVINPDGTVSIGTVGTVVSNNLILL